MHPKVIKRIARAKAREEARLAEEERRKAAEPRGWDVKSPDEIMDDLRHIGRKRP